MMGLYSAVIGLIAAILGLLKILFDSASIIPHVSGRVAAVRGLWHGHVEQPDHPKGFTRLDAAMTLEAKGRRRIRGSILLNGTASGSRPGPLALTIHLKGGFAVDGILR